MTWIIDEAELHLTHPDAVDSVFCMGNGRLSTRGAAMEAGRGAFRGTYLAGHYTRAGYGRTYPLLAPDWRLAWCERDGVVVPLDAGRRCLDLSTGVMTRCAAGPGLAITEERFASLAEDDLLCQRFTITAEVATDLVVALDGVVHNHPAKYYVAGEMPNCTTDGVRLSEVVACVWRQDGSCAVTIAGCAGPHSVHLAGEVHAAAGIAVRRDVLDGMVMARCQLPAGTHVIERLVRLAVDGEAPVPGTTWAAARAANDAAWAAFWADADVVIDGDVRAQRALRFGIFSTRIAAPDDGGHGSIGAKNLTGDWYCCAVFWDMEMYQLPLLAAVAPRLAANHLRYRHHRLPAARLLARQDGYDGARFPWHSFDTGLEEPPVFGTFLYQEIHLNAAVMWGVLHHHALTGDDALMLDCGLELLAEVARYFVSRVTADADGVLHLLTVTGPDEEHQGKDDNAYTNLMVKRLLVEAARTWETFLVAAPEVALALAERLGLADDERRRWQAAAAGLHVPRIPGSTVPQQYAGWADLPAPDNVLRAARGSGTDRSNKQADTLMTWQAFPDITSTEEQAAAYAIYAPLGNHTSSLSFCVHARLAARLGHLRDAETFFGYALGVDLEDSAGNTRHGLHGAGEGGIWLAAIHGFGGLRVERDVVIIDPQLPPAWSRLAYRIRIGGETVAVTVMTDLVSLVNHGRGPARLRFGPAGETLVLEPGGTVTRRHRACWREPQLGGVIFDLDGVLVTTDRYHYQAWKLLANELGLDFDETVNHRLRGVSRQESLRRIYAHNRRALPDAAAFEAQCTTKNTRYVELIGGMGADDILPGAIALLDALRAAGIGVAIASASRNARRVLERCGLTDKIDVVSDGTIVTATKPDPQVFLLAAQRLGCLPWNCLGVEDAESGVEAIHRAGMVAVGFGEQTTGVAEVTVADCAAVDVDRLRKIWADHRREENPYLDRNLAKMVTEEQERGVE